MQIATDPKLQAMIDLLLTRKGQIATLTTERQCKVRKGREAITKRSEFQCRVGVDYDNIKTVIAGRANGEKPAENDGLPWGTWALFPYIIEHKGEYYFRCTTIPTNFKKPAVYTQLGQVITKEAAQADCLASEFSTQPKQEVFNIKISSLLEVK